MSSFKQVDHFDIPEEELRISFLNMRYALRDPLPPSLDPGTGAQRDGDILEVLTEARAWLRRLEHHITPDIDPRRATWQVRLRLLASAAHYMAGHYTRARHNACYALHDLISLSDIGYDFSSGEGRWLAETARFEVRRTCDRYSEVLFQANEEYGGYETELESDVESSWNGDSGADSGSEDGKADVHTGPKEGRMDVLAENIKTLELS